MRFGRWVLAVSLGILLALARVTPAHAAGFRVVVRITSEMSRALSDRIRGQTSDLSIELVTVDTGPLEPSLPAQVGSATTVAQVYDADAVVWFDDIGTSPTGEKRLLVMQTKAKRLLLRGVGDASAPPSKRPPSESAQLEVASLIVRLAVQAMMQGVMIGVEQARIVGEPEKPPPLLPPTPAPKRYEVGDTPDALPGLVRVPVAATFERIGIGAAASTGYGYTESVLGEGDVHQRLAMSVAASLRPNAWLAFAIRLDGRYDWHRHVSTGDSSGWVGEPHLIARAVPVMTGDVRVGAQAKVVFPGEHVPSVDLAATSPELSLFATYAPATSPVAFTSLVGFRVDRRIHTIEDPDRLNQSQRLAIGASDTNALLLGLGAISRVTRNWDAVGEWTWDLRIPAAGTTALESPMRFDVGGRFTPRDSGTLAFQFLFEVSPSARPTIASGEPLVVVEPRVGIVLGLNILPKRAGSPLDEQPLAASAALAAAATGSSRGAISFQPIFPR